MGIIGLGSIGSKVSSICSYTFNMKILFYDPYVSSEKGQTYGANKVSLDELLKLSDFVSLHCSLNKSSLQLLKFRELSLMKQNSFLINTSRGPVISTKDLNKALEEITIRGTALDVYETEPPDKNNILFSPHVAGISYECSNRLSNLSAFNIINAFQYDKYTNCINYNTGLVKKFKDKKAIMSL